MRTLLAVTTTIGVLAVAAACTTASSTPGTSDDGGLPTSDSSAPADGEAGDPVTQACTRWAEAGEGYAYLLRQRLYDSRRLTIPQPSILTLLTSAEDRRRVIEGLRAYCLDRVRSPGSTIGASWLNACLDALTSGVAAADPSGVDLAPCLLPRGTFALEAEVRGAWQCESLNAGENRSGRYVCSPQLTIGASCAPFFANYREASVSCGGDLLCNKVGSCSQHVGCDAESAKTVCVAGRSVSNHAWSSLGSASGAANGV